MVEWWAIMKKNSTNTPQKFNMAPENGGWKTTFLLGRQRVRGYVKLQGGRLLAWPCWEDVFFSSTPPKNWRNVPWKKCLRRGSFPFEMVPLALEVAIILTQRIWEWGTCSLQLGYERFLGGENTQRPIPYGIPSPKTNSQSTWKLAGPQKELISQPIYF